MIFYHCSVSDNFDELGDEQADDIASHLNMAIELMQDGYKGDATKKLKQYLFFLGCIIRSLVKSKELKLK